MGNCCWIASLATQHICPIHILLPFPIFKLPPNSIFQCYRLQTWQFYLFFPARSVSSIQKVPGIKFKGGQVTCPQLQTGLLQMPRWKTPEGDSAYCDVRHVSQVSHLVPELQQIALCARSQALAPEQTSFLFPGLFQTLRKPNVDPLCSNTNSQL